MDISTAVETTTFVQQRQLEPALSAPLSLVESPLGNERKPPIFLGIHKERVKASHFLTKWPILSYLQQLLPEPAMYHGRPVVDALYHTVTHDEGAVFPNVKCGDVLMITRDAQGRLDITLTLRQEDHTDGGIEL